MNDNTLWSVCLLICVVCLIILVVAGANAI
jgi:hypothetical protein